MNQNYTLTLNLWRQNSYTFGKHIDIQSQEIYDDKKFPRKIYIFKKTVQVVCKLVLLNKRLSKFCSKYDKITLNWWFSTYFCVSALKWIMNSRNMSNIPTLKYWKSWYLHPKSDSTICFWASLLMISFEDVNLIFYTWVFNTTIKVALKKKSILNNTLLLLLLDLRLEKFMILVYQNNILVHFTMLTPHLRKTYTKSTMGIES